MKKEIKDNHISMKEEEKQIKRPASYCQKYGNRNNATQRR